MPESGEKMDFVSAEDYLDRGKDFIILEKYSDAIEDLTKAIEDFPDDEFHSEKLFMAYYARGFAYKKLKKYADAMQDFEKAFCFNRKSAEALHNYGICCQILFGEDDAEFLEFVFDDVEFLKRTATHDII